MAVHLTRIYTKTGDDGTTGLGDMSRVAKSSPRIAAFADVDEANAAIGAAGALRRRGAGSAARVAAFADVDEANAAIGAAVALGELAEDVRAVLLRVQNDLFDVG